MKKLLTLTLLSTLSLTALAGCGGDDTTDPDCDTGFDDRDFADHTFMSQLEINEFKIDNDIDDGAHFPAEWAEIMGYRYATSISGTHPETHEKGSYMFYTWREWICVPEATE